MRERLLAKGPRLKGRAYRLASWSDVDSVPATRCAASRTLARSASTTRLHRATRKNEASSRSQDCRGGLPTRFSLLAAGILILTPLRQRFIEDLHLRNRSPKTIEAYVYHVRELARHFKRSPERLSDDQKAALIAVYRSMLG